MSIFGSMENLQASREAPPIEQPAMSLEQPPALERGESLGQDSDMPPAVERKEGAEQADDMPPKIGREEPGDLTLGESVEHRCARHQLARDLANGHRIAAEHDVAKLAKIEAREASK